MSDPSNDRQDPLPLGMVGRSDLSTACHTCVFYSRTQIGSRVLPHVEQVIRSHRQASGFQFYLWPFDVLQRSPFDERARACTEVADVVVVATDGDDELPDSFRSWLEEWQRRRSGSVNRLLALFHEKSPDCEPTPQAFRGLADFALTSGVGFVWCGMPDESLDDASAVPFTAIQQ